MTPVVTVKPQGREEYALKLNGPPVFSAAQGIGYEAATIPCELSEWEREGVLGATVHIHGTGWRGIVTRRPSDHEPLLARGWGWCGTLGRRKALYADTQFLGELMDYTVLGKNAGAFDCSIAGGVVTMGQAPGTTARSGDYRGYYYRSDVELTKLTFSANVNHADVTLSIRGLDASGAPFGTSVAKTATRTYTGLSFTFDAGTYGFRMIAICGTASTPSRFDKWVTVYDMVIYGTDVSTVNTGNVALDVITNEIDPLWLTQDDAHRAWIESETTAVVPLVFSEDSTANAKFETLAVHAANEYGWYSELVNGVEECVPHWFPRSTTPDYVLKVSECESVQLDESSLDELSSVERVHYETIDGRATYTDVTDTDPTHPLVRLGISRYADVSVQTSSSTTATAIGTLAAAENGRRKVKGSVTTRKLLSITGVLADPYAVRGGQMVRVLGLRGGYVDAIVRRVEWCGDMLTLTLDNDGYRLDIALAKLSVRQ